MRFDAEAALEAHESGEPIKVDQKAAARILREHGFTLGEFQLDIHRGDHASVPASYRYDAWTILAWLGY
ncbi:MAG: hypothetical protein ABR949_10250 [Candidatus Aquilonibacter sp.]|jgi:hypothetical protein